MKKTDEVKEETTLKHLKTYDDLVGALGEDTIEFINSGDFEEMRVKMVYQPGRRKTCIRCAKEADKIYAKDLRYLVEKSTFPYDYAVLCESCAKLLAERLKVQIEQG